MHEEAVKNIKRLTRDALDGCSIRDGWPETGPDDVEGLNREVLKHKKDWLNQFDVYRIFIRKIREGLRNEHSDEEKLSGRLTELLSESGYRNLTESLPAFLLSIPREYLVYLPLPRLTEVDIEPLELQQGISIKLSAETIDPNSQGVTMNFLAVAINQLGKQHETTNSYFCVKTKGYCGGSLEDSGTKEALRALKLLLHAGLRANIFEVDQYRSRNVGGNDFMFGIEQPQHKIPKIDLKSMNRTEGKEEVIYTELPLDITRFLQSIYLHRNNTVMEKAKEGKDALASLLKATFTKHAWLIGQDAADAESIKLAIEWGMNSRIVENKTLSFIQICIALESILGDDLEEGQGLTATLADRCAYLLTKGPNNRKIVRRKFRELYRLRI